MNVSEAVMARRSVRGFLDTPVPLATLTDLATRAARAASGGNLQPWHVDIVHGEAIARLKGIMRDTLAAGIVETPEYPVYPLELDARHRDRRFGIGEAMYAHLAIPRTDKDARRAWFARNFAFFDAPAAYFVTIARTMGSAQWQDVGEYLATLMLLAVEAGLATCPQECWAIYPRTIGAFLDVPPDRMLFCGVAIGVEDTAAPVNRLRSERAPADEWLRVIA